MNDLTDPTNQEPKAGPGSQTATPPPPPRAVPLIPVRVLDSRSPFAPLSLLGLTTVPRPGDLITIDLAGRRVSYRVDFVNFEPYDALADVTLGCSPNQPAAAVGQVDPAKINEFIQSQDQAFQKLEAYSKTIIVLGYAGLFAVWGFVKDHLSHHAVVATAMLVGFSLIVYIAWEVGGMVQRTLLHHRFNQTIKTHPADPAKAITDYLEQTRTGQIRATYIWLVVLVLTVGPGFAGALILLYNVLADLTGLPQWP